MAEENQSPSTSDHPNVPSTETKTSNHSKKNELQKENTLYTEPQPKCYIGVGNNSELIESILTSIGYERQIEKTDDFKLKWVQCNQSVNWNSFKDGEQMVNHIQGEDYFTTKLQLWQSLQTYEKISMTMQKRSLQFLPLNQFVPETFKLDEKNDRDAFFNTHKPGDVWICKPSGLNQGKGIYLVRDIESLKSKFAEIDAMDRKKQISVKPMKRVIQRYIMNPLLVQGKKFDIRCYMLISSVKPLLIFYHSGYIRLSMFDFDNNDENLLTHLTNQYMQKKDPKYYDIKEDTAWTMEQFNDYVNKNLASSKNLEQDWVLNVLPKTIQRIMLNVIESIRMRLKRRIGCFGLYGYDFMIDQDMKVWLIEINVNPALTTNTNTLVQAIPPVVKESILLSIECFDKLRHNQKIFPLKSLKGFRCIYNELERKGSLPYIEQRRAASSSPNTRKLPPIVAPPLAPSPKTNTNNSPPNSPKTISKNNDQQQTSVTQKNVIPNINRTNVERPKVNRSSDSILSSLTTTNHSFPIVNPPSSETMVMRYQTIQRYKTNFEILKPATVIAEEWKNLDRTQKDRLAIGGPKALGHGAVASTSSYQKDQNWLVTGRQLTVVDTKTLGTWLKQRQQQQQEKEKEKENENEKNNRIEKLSNSSSGNSSETSSTTTTTGGDNPTSNLPGNFQKINKTRSCSATLRGQSLLPEKPLIIKEIVHRSHPWEYDDYSSQQDSVEPLTKSALIYRLMRSRLEANLAKSISANRDRSNKKKKLFSSTTT
ncbi:unnamed protein product [Rotaria sordida]|uniref:ATP-grasp domain-containing protein n=1 Tax=Rotaria sordida TaxID=392033 RepID=A0A814FLM7_9BILA|nr:unnamed protein product [Rotaria sordida]CAF1141175.1 unnamed protein product [Rotaria sordida]CAF1204807.1 unnamed protein product [Rotaria sordida]CAF1218082.1 unnamed protein product [Rotaria sordida]CAF1276031.1 unnamed protein product [Rotaria sordida]